MIKKSGVLIIGLALIVCSSCNLNSFQKTSVPEFLIENLTYKNADEQYSELPEGVYFDFCNQSEKKVLFVEAKLNLFDLQTQTPAGGAAGTITCSFDSLIQTSEKKEFCIPVQAHGSSSSNIFIDSFYISRIYYSDGTVWFDLFGSYAIQGGR